MFRIPVIATLHGSDVNRQTVRFLGKLILRLALILADRVICVSPPMKQVLASRWPSCGQKLEYIPNGFNPEEILFVGKDTPRENFLFVGRLVSVKGLFDLIYAFQLASDSFPDHLILIGDGPLRQDLENLVAELNMSEKIHFFGEIPHAELNPFYNAARALILPSYSEGMPIVALESLACGTPVIASHVGGLPNLITDDRLGITLPPGDITALAAAMQKANEKTWDHLFIAEYGRHFDWSKNARKTLSVYRDLLSVS